MREKARKIGKGYFFNNTYGLVARREIAEQYGLKTYSDLAAAAGELTFGAEYDFFDLPRMWWYWKMIFSFSRPISAEM